MNRADTDTTPHYDPALGLAGLPSAPRWESAGQRSLYRSDWVSLDLIAVRPPTAPSYEHHVVRTADAVAVVLEHPERGVLMLHRHRFITETTGLELPAGGIDPGEDPVAAAVRETAEETGWAAVRPRLFLTRCVSNGNSDQLFHFVHAGVGQWLGGPESPDEGPAVWVRHEHLRDVLGRDLVSCAPSSLGLLHAMTFGLLRAGAGAGSVPAREQG
ncbi:NUDIX hydrolase [Crossiella sp. CA198]|uniref:NUDIX hydrolase n=1 Tax=Crossiella sp. CA198 TaxID=3455607 RepID=UPI003F8D5150